MDVIAERKQQSTYPKIQSLTRLQPPKITPVNTLMNVLGAWSWKYATEVLCSKSSTPIPANVLETMCVRTDEVEEVFMGLSCVAR